MVKADVADAVIDITDIGVTLRTLLAVAAANYEENPRRVWKIRYKASIVGSVRIKAPKA